MVFYCVSALPEILVMHFFRYKYEAINKKNNIMIQGTKETLPIIIQAIEKAIKQLEAK